MIKVYKCDDGTFAVAGESGWIPGVYDTDGAARLAALKLSDYEIVKRLGPIYQHRPVTLADVSAVIEATNS
jgi:hypothetical protein